MLLVGLDVGSTTIKLVVIDEHHHILHGKYERHFSNIRLTIEKLIAEAVTLFGERPLHISVTGSGGLSVAKWLDIPFIQEVVACVLAVEAFIHNVDVSIELGGEDAKITYFKNGIEQRMNGTCAGGTGAFIDQMASLLNTDAMGLNELAKGAKTIYPIAARCGVFAKSDIQPLLNEGARKEDIAISIFQSVVNQTISGLACGRPIRGNVAFLGGPLYFLSELRKRFIETLALGNAEAISPENSQLYVALGAALHSKHAPITHFEALSALLHDKKVNQEPEVKRLSPLFETPWDYETFKKRHNQAYVPFKSIKDYQGKAYLGIDAGSTTTKLVLINENKEIIYHYYASNQGSPLRVVKEALMAMYQEMPQGITIAHSCVTGYGEALIKAALRVDLGEIETVAHYQAAETFLPNVDLILDIGGQDMKCMTTHEGVIQTVILNEACSAGCGSFIENFATSLNVSVDTFVQEAIQAKEPVDLGSRCTVFMNSKVKQAQKEGASIGDISSGLAYSVIKNALYKVIRLRSSDELKENIIVQGGTFLNDAVLRAFELLTEKHVIRPNIAGIMGAYGAALIAQSKQQDTSTLLDKSGLQALNIESHMRRCDLCQNTCIITDYQFDESHAFSIGNRCERGIGLPIKKTVLPNVYAYKYQRLFQYKRLEKSKAKVTIGMPRALNIYENYPFWHTFFTELGIHVVLSSKSSPKIYQKGIETIPSESVCYPAKLVHGHIMDLLEKPIDYIFYPSIIYEQLEDKEANNQFNCPIVTSYPEVIRHNVDALKEKSVKLIQPFLSFHSKQALLKGLYETFSFLGYTKSAIKHAMDLAYLEDKAFKRDIRLKGEETLKYMQENRVKGIVLAGRPYHIDEEIHHGIDKLIASYGFCVLTEDSIAHLAALDRPLRVVDQWVYHSRLYKAAEVVSKHPHLELVQLTSFGCGLDAVTSDQVQELLTKNEKLYTIIKIDEVNNLGSARIRIRSLKAAIDRREEKGILPKVFEKKQVRVLFDKNMKKNHTILAPQMAPMHFDFVEAAFKRYGYNLHVLKETTHHDEQTGLKHVHNDACYPSILVIGQLIEALQSKQFDLDNTSIMISQTGGGCRATNYIAFIRKALEDAGFSHIPVISLSATGFEKNPGFKLSLGLIKTGIEAIIYGDLLMRMLLRTRPYEVIRGAANQRFEVHKQLGIAYFLGKSTLSFDELINVAVQNFDTLPINDIPKPKVGLVGEILVKYHPYANNDAIGIIESEGGEAVLPDFLDFILYTLKNSVYKADQFRYKRYQRPIYQYFIHYLETLRKPMKSALTASRRFSAPTSIEHKAKGAEKILSLGNQTGEGWFLTGEMVELIESGIPNILCMQPFACLPNHVTGKGMIKALRERYPSSNIVAVDYDPGSSEVNQLNRIKLMMSVAHKRHEEMK